MKVLAVLIAVFAFSNPTIRVRIYHPGAPYHAPKTVAHAAQVWAATFRR